MRKLTGALYGLRPSEWSNLEFGRQTLSDGDWAVLLGDVEFWDRPAGREVTP